MFCLFFLLSYNYCLAQLHLHLIINAFLSSKLQIKSKQAIKKGHIQRPFFFYLLLFVTLRSPAFLRDVALLLIRMTRDACLAAGRDFAPACRRAGIYADKKSNSFLFTTDNTEKIHGDSQRRFSIFPFIHFSIYYKKNSIRNAFIFAKFNILQIFF